MGIFVDKELFEFKVFFIESKSSSANTIKISNEETDTYIVCKCKGRDFENMSKTLEDSTILNSINGNPMLRINIFYKLIIKNFVKEIHLHEGDNISKINITSDSINSLHYNIVKSIAKKWMNITGA